MRLFNQLRRKCLGKSPHAPTSASWLNLVERWFALLTDKQLRSSAHRSGGELEHAIQEYIRHSNRHPKPLRLAQNRRSNPGVRRPLLRTNFRLRTPGSLA